jgi:hypothetical protein
MRKEVRKFEAGGVSVPSADTRSDSDGNQILGGD